MKNLYLILLAMCLAVLFSCSKTNDVMIPGKPISLVTVSDDEINSFIENHFQNKLKLSIENNQLKSASVSGKIYSEYSSVALAEKLITEVTNEKLLRAQTEEEYLGFKVKTKLMNGSVKEVDHQISLKAYVYFSFTTNSYDVETGRPSNPSGIDLYEFILAKQGPGFVILKENKIDFISGPEPEQLTDNESDGSFLKSATSFSYSGKNAANFAAQYWNNVSKVKNYYDYTGSGGDCTNFLSWCLAQGGWSQNNSWFFIASGTSGNDMKKYKRSPSWTGADYFYQYITGTGTMYRNSGGANRVVPSFANLKVPSYISFNWPKFYEQVKLLKLGDIIEIGDGGNPATIHHSMIVTSDLTKSPYVKVTFRNGTGYSPRVNLAINEISAGNILYGFNVRTSAN